MQPACRRFHLVGESIGGTVALAAALARPERIATLTVSNGAHLGASIQRVEAWRRQLDEGGVKAWSDAFMPDRFHDDALSPERRAWFAAQQEKWPRDSILNALGVLIGTDLTPRLREIRCPTLLLHPDGSPFIPVPDHGRAAPACCPMPSSTSSAVRGMACLILTPIGVRRCCGPFSTPRRTG